MKVCTDSCLFGAWIDASEAHTILDIGAGTGLLSLMLAQRTTAEIDAVEIEPEAAREAAFNFKNSPWNHRITLHAADIRGFKPDKKYDLIVCNPPFYEKDLKPASVTGRLAKHSSEFALEELFAFSAHGLSKDGRLVVLLPYARKEACMQYAGSHLFHIIRQAHFRHSPEHDFFRFAGLFSFSPTRCHPAEVITIKANGAYSDGFRHLLSPYYLHL
jgi:tRNA1Val (adenine37-N6)-methyltransferase